MEGKYKKLKVDKTKADYSLQGRVVPRKRTRRERLRKLSLDFNYLPNNLIEMAALLKNEFEELIETTLCVARRLPKCCAPFKEEWTDDKLRDLRRGRYFSHSAYSRNELKKILTRFYYLYCYGEVYQGDNVHATLNDVIAIAQTDLGPIWEAPPPNAKAFYIPNVSQIDDVYMPHLYGRCQTHCKQFLDYINQYITSINPCGSSTENETRLVRLTSFLGLTMYRFATKTSGEMANTFMETQFKNDLISLAEWPANAPFSPPCDSCLRVCGDAMVKGLLNASIVFTIVVNEYVDTNSVEYVNTSAGRMLTAALLNDTALIGLELVQMMENVTGILDIEWRDLLGKTYFKTTRSSWDRIAKFFISQNNINNPQYSFYWAKIIDHGYFRELAPKENLFLATIFGAIIEEVEGPGVWQADWARQSKLSEDAKSIGRALYQKRKQASVQI